MKHGLLTIPFLALLSSTQSTQNLQSQHFIKDAAISARQLISINHDLRPILDNLTSIDFFRFFKIRLYKDCPFWNENMFCNERGCSVEVVDSASVDVDQIWMTEDLGAFSYFEDSPFKISCEYSDLDFCVVEDEKSSDGVFVDLKKNPERYTGYAGISSYHILRLYLEIGESAWRIWKAIYEQNCFNFLYGSDEAEQQKPRTLSLDEKSTDNLCVEKRTFYRIISGMHASISTHLCYQYLFKDTNTWGPNLDCYLSRVGNHPERIENLYFLYSMMLQAVSMLDNYFDVYTYCTGNKVENMRTEVILKDTMREIISHGPYVHVENMFQNDDRLKDQFKQQFRNISKIMDCVGCEKCRLWGRLQVSGIGTALKILFSHGDSSPDPLTGKSSNRMRFQKTEIVSLFNALNKFSGAIAAIEHFNEMQREREKNPTGYWMNQFRSFINSKLYFVVIIALALTRLGFRFYRRRQQLGAISLKSQKPIQNEKKNS